LSIIKNTNINNKLYNAIATIIVNSGAVSGYSLYRNTRRRKKKEMDNEENKTKIAGVSK